MKLLYMLCLCVCFSTQAQSIKILNKSTGEPIPGVAVFNTLQSISSISNFKGVVDISEFKSEENLIFKHISFNRKELKKTEIKTVIYLNPSAEGLDEIIISASKFKENKKDVPNKIVSLTAKNIAFSNPQTAADVLESSGQVYIQKSQLGGGSPMIRGFSTNRLLISVDGVRMNNAIFRGGNLQNVISIDPFSIENTEVILGAGSVIYGSDAIGGVMSFYTKTPKLSTSDSLEFKGNSLVRYASATNEKTVHTTLNLGLKKWGFVTQATYTDFDDLKMGSHGPTDYLRPHYVSTVNGEDMMMENSDSRVQKFTGYNQLNLMQKARYSVKENLYFDLGLFYTTTSNTPRYDRLIRYNDEVLRSAEWYYGPQQWFMSNLNVTKLSSSSPFYNKIKAGVAFQNFNESRIDRDFNSEYRDTSKENVKAITFNVDFEKDLASKTKLFYGLEYVHNKVSSEAFTQNINTAEVDAIVTRYPDGATWQSSAIYASLKHKPNTKLTLQTGLRYNVVSYDANFTANNEFLNLPFDETSNTSGALTGTAGLSWLPNKTLQWRLNFSSAFRAPNIDDVGKVFDSEPGSVVIPNQNLKPEYAYGGELGLTLNVSPSIKLETATYYTYLDNALVRRDDTLNGASEIIYNDELSQVQSIQNASKSWIYGFEVGAKIDFSKSLKLTSQYNITGGTEESDGVESPVRHVTPNFGNTHLIWAKNKFKWDVFASYNNELAFNQLATSEAEKDYIYAKDGDGNPYSPSWYTLNARGSYRINSKVTLTASLENITDQRYRAYSSGIAAAGRNLIASLKYDF